MQQAGTLSRLNDGELIERYSSLADQDAVAELVRRYQPMVLRVCRQAMRGNQEIQDAAQQVFIAMTLNVASLKDRQSIASWLYRVAWNLSWKIQRANSVRKRHETSGWINAARADVTPKLEPDTRQILQQALAQLPEIYQEVIILHYFCGFSAAQVSEKLRRPAGTIAARISRGLDQLRAQLSEEDLILSVVSIRAMLCQVGDRKPAANANGRSSGGTPPEHIRPRARRGWWRYDISMGILPPLLVGSAFGKTPGQWLMQLSAGRFSNPATTPTGRIFTGR